MSKEVKTFEFYVNQDTGEVTLFKYQDVYYVIREVFKVGPFEDVQALYSNKNGTRAFAWYDENIDHMIEDVDRMIGNMEGKDVYCYEGEGISLRLVFKNGSDLWVMGKKEEVEDFHKKLLDCL